MRSQHSVTGDKLNHAAPQEVWATQSPETTASSSSPIPINETSDTRPGRRNRK
ncbi:Uncharacterised protein [Mycobacterium tuberculosis]|nr:Uncharacterised protein [Mycobacterium tuberculosis]COX04156.1 Uncharacterised protein [Mycobacterium tuberculosis]